MTDTNREASLSIQGVILSQQEIADNAARRLVELAEFISRYQNIRVICPKLADLKRYIPLTNRTNILVFLSFCGNLKKLRNDEVIFQGFMLNRFNKTTWYQADRALIELAKCIEAFYHDKATTGKTRVLLPRFYMKPENLAFICNKSLEDLLFIPLIPATIAKRVDGHVKYMRYPFSDDLLPLFLRVDSNEFYALAECLAGSQEDFEETNKLIGKAYELRNQDRINEKASTEDDDISDDVSE